MIPSPEFRNYSNSVDVAKYTPRKILLIDRDNTLNVDSGYTHKVADLRLVKKNLAYLESATSNLVALYIVSNQSGIGRGYYSLKDVEIFNKALVDQLSCMKIRIDGIILCPHTPELDCLCRKPKLGMFLFLKFRFPTAEFAMLGDSQSDRFFASEAKIPFFKSEDDYDLSCLEKWILE